MTERVILGALIIEPLMMRLKFNNETPAAVAVKGLDCPIFCTSEELV
jgi:hypothetical protein